MKKILEERDIRWLLHFTQAENLQNIFRYGLLPKSELLDRDIDVALNDQFRLDKCEDAVCTSISFPNYKMFYRLRMEDKDVDWAVLVLDASILIDYKDECAFCVTNAGSAESFSIPIHERMGKKALKKLFDELPNGPSRRELGIHDSMPTNPQAEVLVFGGIPVYYIKEVLFENKATLEYYLNIIPPAVGASANQRAFSYRNDWQYWKMPELST